MVPDCMAGESLGFLLVKYPFVAFIFVWETRLCRFCLFWMDCDASDEVSISVSGAWYVLPSGGEDGSFSVISAENDG